MEAGAGYAIGAAIVFLCASSVIAAVGTMLPVVYPKPANVGCMKHYQILIKSVGLTAASALLYGLVHYGIVGVRTL
jgi:amino acid transporter